MTVKTPAALASSAAEAVRTLNHATLSPGRYGWEYPGDAYQVIGGLDQTAGRMNQALEQIWALLSGLAADGHVRSDRGTPDADLTATRTALDTARAAADQLTTALRRAHSAASHLGLHDDTDTGDFPCGESGCQCHCPGSHVCGCDCPRCPYCQQHPEYCDCDE